MSMARSLHSTSLIQVGLNAEIAFARAIAEKQLISPAIIAIATGLSSSVLNYVIDTQVHEAEIDDKIKMVREFYRAANLNWTWVVGPLSRPATLTKHLKEHGLVFLESYPGLFTDLYNPVHYYPLKYFAIHEVGSSDHLRDWIQPVRESFPNTDNAEGYRLLLDKIPHGHRSQFYHYVGYYELQPVSAATLFLHREVAMIHNICTKPAFRGRGFAKAMTTFVMMQAAKFGYNYCFLDSSEHGLELYRKLGFQVYCHYHVYKLNKSG